MVTTRAAVTPGETVNTGELAAALRAAGLAEVETATRRRAEYSSDASNYRVVPQVVAFPRGADEIMAALAVCRALNAPLVRRGGRPLRAGGPADNVLALHVIAGTGTRSTAGRGRATGRGPDGPDGPYATGATGAT